MMTRSRRLLFALMALVIPATARADDGQIWTTVSATGTISGKLRGSLDAIARFDGDGLYEWVGSAELGYQLDKHVTLWAGYVHKTAYANNSASIEQRAREDVTFDDVARIGPVRLGGRVRAEERWRDDRAGTGWRVRPQIKLTLPLRKDGPALVAAVEGFVNLDAGAGQRAGYDRTRVSIGVAVPLTKKLRLDAGYLRQTTRRADAVGAATLGLAFRW